ncbi:PAS domain-containing protein [Chitinophaga horti]|uniref:PAS domain-containing protein n=1 Tax=Chitinophaga horti TaxID=2920382 RepID=A0ABY6IV88_9BACT|nr:PAS domain-containing protein [Chitinophaga horti]UYQ91281.1 PAS domain-containing protein [Chitinophaga horti]
MLEKHFHAGNPDGPGAEHVMRMKDEQLRALVENTPDAITRWDSNFRLVFANNAFAEKSGTPVNEALGKTSVQMGHPPEVSHAFVEKLRKVFETQQPQEHYNYYPSPEGNLYFHSRMVPEFAVDGTVTTVLNIARDITHTHNIKIELEEVNRRCCIRRACRKRWWRS